MGRLAGTDLLHDIALFFWLRLARAVVDHIRPARENGTNVTIWGVIMRHLVVHASRDLPRSCNEAMEGKGRRVDCSTSGAKQDDSTPSRERCTRIDTVSCTSVPSCAAHKQHEWWSLLRSRCGSRWHPAAEEVFRNVFFYAQSLYHNQQHENRNKP